MKTINNLIFEKLKLNNKSKINNQTKPIFKKDEDLLTVIQQEFSKDLKSGYQTYGFTQLMKEHTHGFLSIIDDAIVIQVFDNSKDYDELLGGDEYMSDLDVENISSNEPIELNNEILIKLW